MLQLLVNISPWFQNFFELHKLDTHKPIKVVYKEKKKFSMLLCKALPLCMFENLLDSLY